MKSELLGEKLTCKKCGLIDVPNMKHSEIHCTAYCKGCGSYIKHVSQRPCEDDFILHFGKYKGRSVQSMVGNTTEEFNYLIWLRDNATSLKPWQLEILKKITS